MSKILISIIILIKVQFMGPELYKENRASTKKNLTCLETLDFTL